MATAEALILRPACWKVAYATRDVALEARAGIRRRRGDRGLSVYICPDCAYWHLGHWRGMPPTRRVRL